MNLPVHRVSITKIQALFSRGNLLGLGWWGRFTQSISAVDTAGSYAVVMVVRMAVDESAVAVSGVYVFEHDLGTRFRD